jgi:Rrf2 family iron-responsive transcriptional regulator
LEQFQNRDKPFSVWNCELKDWSIASSASRLQLFRDVLKGTVMRLTRQTNYAVRMLMYCAANDGKLSRIPEIARAYGVSELFLFKILQPLVEHGLVETVRGRNGGVRLGRAAQDISLFDVVRVTEENFAMAECFENDATECPLVDSCALNSALREALNAFFAVLMKYSIADLVKARPNVRHLLGLDEMEEERVAS